MGKRSAGIGVRKAETDNNVYFHRLNAEELITYLKKHFVSLLQLSPYNPPCRVLDACAGREALGRVFKEKYGCEVTFQDIKQKGESILDYKPGHPFDIIVCNPPWIPVELPEAIYKKLVTLLAPGGVLFFIVNNTFCYQGPDRATALFFNKFYFLPRYTFASSGHPLLDCGVMVYHNGGDMLPDAALLRPFIPLSRVRGEIMEELL